MYCSAGTLKYHRMWVILLCDRGIIEYYASMIPKYEGEVQPPKHGSHVSVVRKTEEWCPGTRPMEGERIHFRYENRIRWNQKYIWIRVKCKKLEEIRQQLGLPRKPELDFHITIGTWVDWQERAEARGRVAQLVRARR